MRARGVLRVTPDGCLVALSDDGTTAITLPYPTYWDWPNEQEKLPTLRVIVLQEDLDERVLTLGRWRLSANTVAQVVDRYLETTAKVSSQIPDAPTPLVDLDWTGIADEAEVEQRPKKRVLRKISTGGVDNPPMDK